MFIQRVHQTTASDAKSKIDRFLDDLMKREFDKVKISNPRKEWSGNEMGFSFKASKGFTWTTVRGTITIDEKIVSLDARLGKIARQLVSEDQVRKAVDAQFDKLFGM